MALPDGVIGNTWAFGAHVPGSSPGRVDKKVKSKNCGSLHEVSNVSNTRYII